MWKLNSTLVLWCPPNSVAKHPFFQLHFLRPTSVLPRGEYQGNSFLARRLFWHSSVRWVVLKGVLPSPVLPSKCAFYCKEMLLKPAYDRHGNKTNLIVPILRHHTPDLAVNHLQISWSLALTNTLIAKGVATEILVKKKGSPKSVGKLRQNNQINRSLSFRQLRLAFSESLSWWFTPRSNPQSAHENRNS